MSDDHKAHGVFALNQEYVRFDQVEKRQSYHLAEAGHQETFDKDYGIPTYDLARFLHGDEAIGALSRTSWGKRCAASGLRSSKTGVDPRPRRGRSRHPRAVHANLPRNPDAYRAHRHGSVNQGYFPIRETSDIHPDLVLGWVFCRRAFDLGEDPAYGSRTSGLGPSWSQWCAASPWPTRP